MPDSSWNALLAYTDLCHLTLPLAHLHGYFFPAWVQDRVGRNLSDNKARLQQVKSAYLEVAAELRKAGLQHLVIKGFAQWEDYVADPSLRLQSDIDIFCPPDSAFPAAQVLAEMGYKVVPTGPFSDHLPMMVRQQDWKWRDNFFDPEIPAPLEVHYRLWNRARFRFGPTELNAFWSRRIVRSMPDFEFPALQCVDNLALSALHVLRDLCNNGLSPQKLYELAHFLHKNVRNSKLWNEWMQLHDPALRQWQAVAFRLAQECFGNEVAPEVSEELQRLPRPIRRWIVRYGLSSLWSCFPGKSKDYLWLHVALLDSLHDKLAVSCRTLLPAKFRIQREAAWTEQVGPQRDGRRNKTVLSGLRIASRIGVHAAAITPTLWQGVKLFFAGRLTKATCHQDGNAPHLDATSKIRKICDESTVL
jgi:hypothetical protein